MKKLYILIGPPGSGKSTWLKNVDNLFIISRDEIVEAVALDNGLTYDEMFVKPINTNDVSAKYGNPIEGKYGLSYDKINTLNNKVYFLLTEKTKKALESSLDVAIDLTNMSVSERKDWIKKFVGYAPHAIDFKVTDKTVHLKIINKRNLESAAKGRPKTISAEVLDMMLNRYVQPTKAEGFVSITTIDNTELFRKL